MLPGKAEVVRALSQTPFLPNLPPPTTRTGSDRYLPNRGDRVVTLAHVAQHEPSSGIGWPPNQACLDMGGLGKVS